ncbi:DUF2157 domain-containing protein [Leptospira idonii]|uniref:DUF2157 domain-containing protein n=1 Tax=Leptospira idonii TaxID=1193500 RepID=A0A4R9LZ68_9LEPT|nr:DUF2157 domain-containing protein [Leptospira idonii]TGN18199.1 DUF2157 domain-containing protein [Leptospira idonii]
MLFEKKQNALPDLQDWSEFGKRFFFLFGFIFLITGIIFFFAFNWNELHRYAKLILVGSIFAVASFVYSLKLSKPWITEILGVLAFVLVGQLLLVFGQIYQTGADAYDLFFGWTIFSFLIVLSSKSYILWSLWIFLINLTYLLYQAQVMPHSPSRWVFDFIFFINILILGIYEIKQKFYSENQGQRSIWFPSVILVLALGWFQLGFFTPSGEEESGLGIYLIFKLFLLAGIYYIYRFLFFDLAALTFLSIEFLIYITFCFSHYYPGEDIDQFLLSFLLVIGCTTASVIHLLRLRKGVQNK